MKLGVFGVGRSGTTALYTGIQHMLLASGTPCRFLYEPYLWSPKVFDAPFTTVTQRFQSTNSLSVEGLYAHHVTPLFAGQGNPVHDQFLKALTQGSDSFLLKSIRANGRLSLFLEAFPDLKAVLIIRNPLDVVNSVIDRFSFFGDEFHPSDKPRFIAEVSSRFAIAELGDVPKNEVVWALWWWRYMNRAALQTAEQHRERVLVVAYEAFNQNPVRGLQHIGEFLGLDLQTLTTYKGRPVGEVSKQVYLHPQDVDYLLPQAEEYWYEFVGHSAIALNRSQVEPLQASLANRYRAGANHSANPQSTQIPPDWNPLLVRRQLLQVRAENDALRLAQPGAAIPAGNGKATAAGWEHRRFLPAGFKDG
ncbi:MAG: sulfotransferase [Cyanobacteria bacterium P01_A01_bin.135]